MNELRLLRQGSYVGIQQGVNFKQNQYKMNSTCIHFYSWFGVFFPNQFKYISTLFWYKRQMGKRTAVFHWVSRSKLTAIWTLCKWSLSLGKRVVYLKPLNLNLNSLLFTGLNPSIWEAWRPLLMQIPHLQIYVLWHKSEEFIEFHERTLILHWLRIWFLLNLSIHNDRCVGEVTHENYLVGMKLVNAPLKQKWWWHMAQVLWYR